MSASSLNKIRPYFNVYGDFITKNAHAVSQIESALRSLTYIVPARFKDVELASEGLHSSVQLLSLYHDSLLSHAVSNQLPSGQKPTPHNRYTKFWTTKSPMYKRLALMVTMIQYTELLWEMCARRKGEMMRWRVIIVLEIAKAICRLTILKLTKSRMLLTSPLPDREVDPATLSSSSSTSSSAYPSSGESTPEEWSSTPNQSRPSTPVDSTISPEVTTAWKMPRTGLSLPSLPDPNHVSAYLLSKVLTAEDIKPPIQLLHRVRSTGYIAEILYILRPVIYALAMKNWSHDKKSWRPWLLGLSIEYASRTLARKAFSESVPGGLKGLTALEKEEMTNRKYAMGWWILRGAFYEHVTGPCLEKFVGRLEGLPLLGLFSGVVEDYRYLWSNYYFSTATL